MKKLLSFGTLVIVLAVTSIVVSPTINAQTATPPTQAQCTVAQTRLTERITKVEAAKTARLKVYTQVQAKLDEIVTSANASEYDTAALVKAQETLVTNVTAFTEKATAYSTALLAAKNVTCGATNTEFVTAITNVRAALAAVRTATLDVKTTFTGDVVKELQAYKLFLKDNTSTGDKK